MIGKLREFWGRQGRLSRIVLVVAAVVLAVFVIGVLASQSQDDDEAGGAATETTGAPAATDPVKCLRDLGLSDAEQRDTDLWRAFNTTPFYGIRVALLPTDAEARQAVQAAVDVYAARAGRYAVFGPLKPGVEGAELDTSDEGASASNQVQAVATCLGG